MKAKCKSNLGSNWTNGFTMTMMMMIMMMTITIMIREMVTAIANIVKHQYAALLLRNVT